LTEALAVKQGHLCSTGQNIPSSTFIPPPLLLLLTTMLRSGRLVRLLGQQLHAQAHVGHPEALAGPFPAAAALTEVITQSSSAPLSWQLLSHRQQDLHTSISTAVPLVQHVVQLDRLKPAAGSTKVVGDRLLCGAIGTQQCAQACLTLTPTCLQAKRWGRGDGGDRGTYCGRGVKGQKARKGKEYVLLCPAADKMPAVLADW
jgi:hypothetical protein